MISKNALDIWESAFATANPPVLGIAARHAIKSLIAEVRRLHTLRPLSEWHEDFGDVIWWHLPICEPPVIGTNGGEWNADGTPTHCMELIDSGWLTHWSPLPNCNEMVASDSTEVAA